MVAMTPRRKIDFDAGMGALRTWCGQGDGTPRRQQMTAVRFCLEELEQRHPGRAVEVRVPPAGAVQILKGTTHRRGTPPAVVEMSMPTWLRLATGDLSWDEGDAAGLIQASGQRTDLAALLPLFDGQDLAVHSQSADAGGL